MEKDITPVSIANSIMLDTNYSNYYVLVEGAKDSKLFQKFFNKEQVRIKETFGCDKLQECQSILEERGYERCFGIIDRDFHEILGTTPQKDNLFIVDHHDIEIVMMNSKAFEYVLNIFTTQEKIASFETAKEKSLLDIIFELGNQIGYLKLANKIHGLGLVFKPREVDGNQIAYNKFISDKLDFVGLEVMVNKIIDYSRNKSDAISSKEEIITKYNELIKNKYDRNHLSNGHDISNILFIFLKKVVRSSNRMLVDFNSIEDSLILAYDINEFQKTNLYTEIKNFADDRGIDLFNV
ncbi:hypothetical protein [Dysgonomonas sp.]